MLTKDSARKFIDSKNESRMHYFVPIMTEKQLEELYTQAVQFKFCENVSFKALKDKELTKLLKNCSPTAK